MCVLEQLLVIQTKKLINVWDFFEEEKKKVVSFKLDEVLDIFQSVWSELI